MRKSALVVGAGFSGLSLAALLAHRGWNVRVVEKNAEPGGRARVWRSGGYTFDMGPTWYLMPEVFDRFFEAVGARREDYYRLATLDPSYRVYFGDGVVADVVRDREKSLEVFERLEPGVRPRLEAYLEDSRVKYDTALESFLYRDYRTVFQFLNRKLVAGAFRLSLLRNLEGFVEARFRDNRVRQLLQYHMVFLGNVPRRAPALYSLMSHADLDLGVHYPLVTDGRRAPHRAGGGIGCVVDSLVDLCTALGVQISLGREVSGILVRRGRAAGVRLAGGEEIGADLVAVSADYAHAETELLEPVHRSYPRRYWEGRALAPSMFLLYLGLDMRTPGLAHHTLHFAADWQPHFRSIADNPAWPDKPCFYLCSPARTDPGCATAGGEALMVLVPVAAGLPDTPEIRESYRERVLDHVEEVLGSRIREHIRVERLYTVNDFAADYNAWRGTALGLAHTLGQTAVFRPAHHSRKVRGLWYTGAYTHPGIGVPMALISSHVVADRIAETRS